MEDYEKECSKRKARAEKFGTKYAPPKLEAFLPWSEAKRLKAKPKKGFTTGFDMLDSEEVRKQAARRARFSVSTATATGEPNDGKAPLTESATQSSTTVEKQENGTLPVVQAWDKQEIVSEYRVDPPMSLRTQPGSDSPDKTPYKLDPDNKQAPPTWIREKIHIFAIDWAAFKQMRNKDIMGFFSAYGPSYIEWLADLSCNIYFNDKFTAKRALMNLSQSIPSPPPPALGSIHTYPDLGNMTWRFCNRPIQKLANDRFGRKGTTARFLVRLAMSTDQLEERPNQWPAPPGGFSPGKILGPDSDYARPSARPKSGQTKDSENIEPGDHPMLKRSLESPRPGFSIEELEAERATKKHKPTSGG